MRTAKNFQQNANINALVPKLLHIQVQNTSIYNQGFYCQNRKCNIKSKVAELWSTSMSLFIEHGEGLNATGAVQLKGNGNRLGFTFTDHSSYIVPQEH